MAAEARANRISSLNLLSAIMWMCFLASRANPSKLLMLSALWSCMPSKTIGGAGAQADAMAIWLVQWVGETIRVLDYVEGVGQVLAY